MATYRTRPVLADAYPRKQWKDIEEGKARFLRHTVELDDAGAEVRVLCKRVKLDAICGEGANDPGEGDAKPTCPTCAKRDPRFNGSAP